MALVVFTTHGNNPDQNRVAVNPDHVVSVTPYGAHAAIWMSTAKGDGYLVYNVNHDFDEVVIKLRGG